MAEVPNTNWFHYPDKFDGEIKNEKSRSIDIIIFKVCKLSINKTFLPVKAALFCWFAAGNIEDVYLPVFLKLKGFSLLHLSIFSAISVVFQFSGAILTGILTDKTGRPKVILLGYFTIFSLICLAFIFTPDVKECNTKQMNFQCVYDMNTHLSTTASCNVFKNDSATVKCKILKLANLSHNGHDADCIPYNNSIDIFNIEKHDAKNNTDLCQYNAYYKNGSTKSITLCDTELCKPIQINCKFDSLSECNENRRLWIVIYGIMVALLNMSFTISYRLFDIIVVDLTHEHNNDFGRQRVWSILGSLSGPPIAGFLLHRINKTENEKSYTVAFITIIVFTILSALSLWQVKTKLCKPSAKMWRKALVLGRKLEIWLFVLLLMVMGSCYGFRAIYGSWYLQGIGATDLLLGVSRGMSDLYGLPFLYSSKWWINKIGYRAIFIPALLGNAIYCFSFSFLEVPWPAVIIESSLILAYHLYWVAVMQYVICITPKGLQATVRALAGSIQYNLSKVISTTVGGYLMSEYGGRGAFRVLGSIAFIYAIVYGSYLRMDYLRKKKSTIQSKSNQRQFLEAKISHASSE